MKHLLPRFAAIALGGILLMAAYQRANSSSVMSKAATAFLNSLSAEQRAKATFTFDQDERMDWHFIPKPRKGLPLREMDSAQKHLATALLSAGLSQQGIIKAETIMSLEDVLKAIEKDDGEKRNPEKYYFSVFGEPSDTGTWGYRVEGHHVSQNYTVVDGRVSSTPSFFGANPAQVPDGPRKGLRALAEEEDMGRELLKALTPDQQKVAVVDQTAYKDIITMASRKAALDGQPSGLSASKMTASQFALLTSLVEMYARNMPGQVADARIEKLHEAGKNVYFAWAGGAEKGQPHYYRVQTPAFLIEFDDTQDHANHIHSVWRDYKGDFGLDMLAAHYQTGHNK